MQKPLELHVISNTHWDREWLYNFQETRMMLVECLDRLLDILDGEPRYKAYLFDSQTVPIEDYLEIRPQARDRIRKHVTAGRLLVGPWYTCPECFIVNGESLVRNLLYGHHAARRLGKVMKVGHTPFSYGQNSQMPQIYAGFGIDTILFYHGVSHDEVSNEFLLEGADGTRVLASQMSSNARYNFYHAVYRPLVFGKTIRQREYEWSEGGAPFHLCGEAHCMEHHFLLDPARSFHEERLADLLQQLRRTEAAAATTRHIAFMMGHDASVPDLVELRIIDQGRQHLKGDRLFHSSLPDYMKKVKQEVRNLVVLHGERRTPKLMNGRLHLYSDVLSSRTRMKRLNARAEYALQRIAEPFASLAWLLGREYPATLLDLAWTTLLKSHAHDSIAGSGVDDIERDVTDRLRQVVNIADGVARRSLQDIQVRIDNADAGANEVRLTVFNPSPFPRSEVVTAVVDYPGTSGPSQFSLREPGDSRPVSVQAWYRKPHHAVINHAEDATAMMTCRRIAFHFEAKDVPPLGYATYCLDPEGSFSRGGLVTQHNTMENEYLSVHIENDGTFTVLHKKTGTRFDGLHYFEDAGEAGHAWMHIEPATDRIISTRGLPVSIALEENGPLLARYRVEYRMRIPAGLDENGGDPWQRLDGAGSSSKRTEEMRELVLTSICTLRKGSPCLEVLTRFDNPAENHRLRAVFPTHRKARTCSVESAFDVVQREIEFGPESPWYGGVNATFPMHRFVDVSDGNAGLAVINDGLREYEVTQGPDRAIALTLLRAFQVSLTTVSFRWEPHPEMTLSQAPGAHEFRYWILPHESTWDKGGVSREVERLSVALEPAQVGRHAGQLPKRHSFLSVEPSNLVLSALKRSEDGRGLILRLFNPTDGAITGRISTFRLIRSLQRVTLEEKPLQKEAAQQNSATFKVAPKKIITLKLVLAPQKKKP